MEVMKRSDLARRTGVTGEAVRFYEDNGVLPPPPRSASGYRLYDESYVDRIRFVRRAQELGFTLTEIKELLALRVLPGADRAEVRQHAEEKRADVVARIRDLERIRDVLTYLIDACDGHGPASDCPILEALDQT